MEPNHKRAGRWAQAHLDWEGIEGEVARAYEDLEGQNRDLVKALQELSILSEEGEINGDFDGLDEASGEVLTKMDEVIKAALLGTPEHCGQRFYVGTEGHVKEELECNLPTGHKGEHRHYNSPEEIAEHCRKGIEAIAEVSMGCFTSPQGLCNVCGEPWASHMPPKPTPDAKRTGRSVNIKEESSIGVRAAEPPRFGAPESARRCRCGGMLVHMDMDMPDGRTIEGDVCKDCGSVAPPAPEEGS